MNLVIGSHGEAAQSPAFPARRAEVSEPNVAEPSLARKISSVLEDAGLLLCAVVLLPAAILVIGTPLALFVRMLVWIVRQFQGV